MSSVSKLRWPLLCAVAALVVGVAIGMHRMAPRETRTLATGTLLPEPRPISDFSLQGADGKPYTRADLLGHWTVAFAGYTYCPDVCPATLAQLKATRADLGDKAGQVEVLFISVDPQRDTPERLARYVAAFDPGFRAATAPVPTLEKLGAALGFVFNKVPGRTPDTYSMDHSAALILIDPQARVAGFLMPPFQPPQIAADLRNLMG